MKVKPPIKTLKKLKQLKKLKKSLVIVGFPKGWNAYSDGTPVAMVATINNEVEKFDIPKNSILFPLTIKVGQRVKNFKRFSSSMNGKTLEEIENYTKNKNIKKSDFFTIACLEYMGNHP